MHRNCMGDIYGMFKSTPCGAFFDRISSIAVVAAIALCLGIRNLIGWRLVPIIGIRRLIM